MLTDQLAPAKLDPRVKRTRNLLENAFMDLIQEKGFQAVTVQDITERAGVNRATFYAHFADKYALLDYRIRQGFLEEIDKRMLNACHLTRDNLRNLIVAVCEFTRTMNAHCKPAQAQFESLVEAQVKGVLQELMRKWLEQVPLTVAPETAATASSWAIYGLVLQWSHARQPRPVDEFAAEALPLVAPMLNLSLAG
ncbi:MAG TPA: TetR family transcriptional regulator [Anaerolineales bacterium]